MQDYVNRTVTMEDHLHLKGARNASIHPCQVGGGGGSGGGELVLPVLLVVV